MSLKIYIKQLNQTMQELVKLKEEKEQKNIYRVNLISLYEQTDKDKRT